MLIKVTDIRIFHSEDKYEDWLKQSVIDLLQELYTSMKVGTNPITHTRAVIINTFTKSSVVSGFRPKPMLLNKEPITLDNYFREMARFILFCHRLIQFKVRSRSIFLDFVNLSNPDVEDLQCCWFGGNDEAC
jgi:hypothetical protein